MKGSLALLALRLLLLAGPTVAQTRAADSLQHLLEAHPNLDSTRVRRLLALTSEVSDQNIPQATALSHRALSLAQQINDPAGEGQALLWLSGLYRRQADYERGRRYAQQAIHLFGERADRRNQAYANLQLSLNEQMPGNLTAALTSALQGLPLAEQAGDQRLQTRLQATVGSIYSDLGDYDTAIPALQKALKSGEQLGEQQVVSTTMNALGSIYQKQKDWPRAISYYAHVVELSRKLGDVQNEIVNETSLAEVYALQGNLEQALAHSWRARHLTLLHRDLYNLPTSEVALARAYLLAGRPDSAIALARHGLQLSQQSRSNENISKASQLLAQAYSRIGDSARAYRYQTLYVTYKDTLAGEEVQRKTSALRYSYESDKQKNQIDRQRQQLYGLLAGLVAVVVVALLLLRNIMLKQRTNRHLSEKNAQIETQRDEIAGHRDDLDRALTELKTTQTQLIQREKMALLGELTAGVAHEIQNPLNFINNFSEVNNELLAELDEELTREVLSDGKNQTVSQLLENLTRNQQKIHQHGRRADNIVKGMLEHSRNNPGQRQPTDLNALAEESLHLAFHGLRAKNKDFNAKLTTHFDSQLGSVMAVPQDLSRVLLNLFTNAFYAVAEKKKQLGDAYQPEVTVGTRRVDGRVELRVRDNGTGIPQENADKIFQPFFTTKPPGEGTGLGLSLSYDIITKDYGGTLAVQTQLGEFAEFVVSLPAAKI